MKVIKDIDNSFISDEIDQFLIEKLKTDQTIKQLAKMLIDNFQLNIEVSLDRVNSLLYKLNQFGLIEGYSF